MKLSDKDLYQLRKARLLIEKRTLAAQQAEQAYRELLLEIRNECGIIGQATPIDLETGEIANPSNEKPSNGKSKDDLGELATVAEGS